MKTNKFISKFIIFLIIFSTVFTAIPTSNVQAKITGHDTNVLLPTIDTDGRYSYIVVVDENDWGHSLETGGTGYDIFNDGFSYLKFLSSQGGKEDVNISQSISDVYTYNFGITQGNINDLNNNASEPDKDFELKSKLEYMNSTNLDSLMLSFPGHDAGGWGDNQYNKNDYARASEVGETLISNLNNALDYLDALDSKDDIRLDTLGDAIFEMSKGISNPLIEPGTQYKYMGDLLGVTIVYCGRGAAQDGSGKNGVHYLYDAATKDKQLYAYIVDGNISSIDDDKLKTYPKFVWAQLKGYLDEDGKVVGSGTSHNAYVTQNCSTTNVNSGEKDEAVQDIGDITWLTIFDLANVANYYYYSSNAALDFSASTNVDKPGFIEKTIAEIALKLVHELKNLLGLEDITALVYHAEGNSITGGVMDMKWWSVMLKYHLIFQILAWIVIGLALCKTILELNLSTINPNKRVSIMEEVQKLLMVGFLLALAIPIIRAMIELNNVFVGIFATQIDLGNGDLSAFSGVNGLAGCLFAFMYLGLAMTINCVYIMRGVMIAIFGASAPLFIVSMLFVKGKGMFDQWLKEMAANIFLQTVHAFSYAFLMEVVKAGSGLASLVVVYSLMPITEQFRNLIFGGAGSAVGLGGQAAGGLTQMGTAALKAGGSIAGNAVNNGLMNRTELGKGLKANGEGSTGTGASGGSGSGKASGSGGAADTLKAMSNNLKANPGASTADLKTANRLQKLGTALNMGSSGFDAASNMMMSGIGMATGNQQMATQHAKASFDAQAAQINEGTTSASDAKAERKSHDSVNYNFNGGINSITERTKNGDVVTTNVSTGEKTDAAGNTITQSGRQMAKSRQHAINRARQLTSSSGRGSNGGGSYVATQNGDNWSSTFSGNDSQQIIDEARRFIATREGLDMTNAHDMTTCNDLLNTELSSAEGLQMPSGINLRYQQTLDERGVRTLDENSIQITSGQNALKVNNRGVAVHQKDNIIENMTTDRLSIARNPDNISKVEADAGIRGEVTSNILNQTYKA